MPSRRDTKPSVLGLIRMGTGNVLSVQTAFAKVGLECRVIEKPDGLAGVDGVILPGVGAFHVAMESLAARGFVAPLRQTAQEGRIPILGICLGMQLLADESEEHGVHKGLGLVPGRVVRLNEEEIQSKVPNVGWCETAFPRASRFAPKNVVRNTFYYVHSYHFAVAEQQDVAAVMRLGACDVAAAVERGLVAGVQFHPEKSQDNGLDLLARWAVNCGLTTAATNAAAGA